MNRRPALMFAAAAVGLLAALAVAAPAAAVTPAEKLGVMSSFTQPTVASYAAWDSARRNQGQWTEYHFDWSTDYCSTSPDEPLGFDFRLPCQHHDWGYRNYKAMGAFPANKDRIDTTFHTDMLRVCDGVGSLLRPACTSVAWIYYQAVQAFGSLAVTPDDLRPAADLKARAETRRAV